MLFKIEKCFIHALTFCSLHSRGVNFSGQRFLIGNVIFLLLNLELENFKLRVVCLLRGLIFELRPFRLPFMVWIKVDENFPEGEGGEERAKNAPLQVEAHSASDRVAGVQAVIETGVHADDDEEDGIKENRDPPLKRVTEIGEEKNEQKND